MEKEFNIGEFLQEISQMLPKNLSTEHLIYIVANIKDAILFLSEKEHNDFTAFSAKKAYEFQEQRFAKELEKRGIMIVSEEDLAFVFSKNPEYLRHELIKFDIIQLMKIANDLEELPNKGSFYEVVLEMVNQAIIAKASTSDMLN